MEKVKIFREGINDNFDDLEEKVNTWLKKHPIKQVFSRNMSITSGTVMPGVVFINCTICIFYED